VSNQSKSESSDPNPSDPVLLRLLDWTRVCGIRLGWRRTRG